jgi:hypothetical protein
MPYIRANNVPLVSEDDFEKEVLKKVTERIRRYSLPFSNAGQRMKKN